LHLRPGPTLEAASGSRAPGRLNGRGPGGGVAPSPHPPSLEERGRVARGTSHVKVAAKPSSRGALRHIGCSPRGRRCGCQSAAAPRQSISTTGVVLRDRTVAPRVAAGDARVMPASRGGCDDDCGWSSPPPSGCGGAKSEPRPDSAPLRQGRSVSFAPGW
jgi:hypothetical protein